MSTRMQPQIASLMALAHTRRPWNNVAMFANPALNLAEKGFMGIAVYEGYGLLPELGLVYDYNLRRIYRRKDSLL